MRSPFRCIGCLFLFLPWQHTASGADLEHRVREWLRSARAEATAATVPTDFRMVYEAVVPNHVTDEQLAEWRRQTRATPQHPLRSEIIIAERRIARGPDVDRHTLWFRNADRWRLNVDSNYLPEEFLDIGLVTGEGWSLTGESLSLHDAGGGERSSVAMAEKQFTQDVRLFLLGGVMIGRSADLETMKVTGSESRWNASLSNERGWRWTYVGSLRSENGAGRIDRIEEYRPESSKVTRQIEFADYSWNELVQREVAGNVSVWSEPYGIKQLRLTELVPEGRSRLREVTNPPVRRRGGLVVDDAVRGQMEVSRVVDTRGGRATVTSAGDDGPRTMDLQHAQTSWGRRLRQIGWLTGVLVVVALFSYRLARHRSA